MFCAQNQRIGIEYGTYDKIMITRKFGKQVYTGLQGLLIIRLIRKKQLIIARVGLKPVKPALHLDGGKRGMWGADMGTTQIDAFLEREAKKKIKTMSHQK